MFFLLLVLASLLIVPGVVLILVLVLGWQVLIVLGGVFVGFVLILTARTCFLDWRAARKDENRW